MDSKQVKATSKPKLQPKRQQAKKQPETKVPVRTSDGDWKQWILLAGILLVTFLIFSPATRYDYVNWDDDVNVTQNRNVRELTANTVKSMFTSTVIGGYTPLTTLSFAVEEHFFGNESGTRHLVNIFLHLVCISLVFIFMRKLGMNLFISSLVTVLFALHPMRVESVAWITERKDVLYASFYMLSLILYVSYYKTRKPVYYIASLLVFILSLLSKIQAVSLPLSLMLIDFWFEKRFQIRQLINKIPFFILSAITGLVGVFLLKEAGSLETSTILPFYQRIFIGTYALVIYLVKSVYPYEMSAIYPFPSQLNWLYYLSLPVVIGLGWLFWKFRKSSVELIFGLLFFIVNVIFMLQVVGAGQGFIADRFTYIGYTGLFFVIAFYIDKLGSYSKIIMYSVVTVYLLIMVITTFNRVKVWQNSETLFTDVIAKYPKVAVAHNNMGRYFRELKDYNKAIASYNKAIEINPKGASTFNNRGKAYFDLGRTQEAMADFDESLKLNPDNAEALSNRGAALASQGEFDKAFIDLDKAIRLSPSNINAYSNRSLAYFNTKQFEKAILDVNAYLQLKPNDPDMLNLRALSYGQLNKNDESLSDLDLAIQLNPTQGVFYQNRSSLHNKMGNKKKALVDILKAQELGLEVKTEYIQYLEKN